MYYILYYILRWNQIKLNWIELIVQANCLSFSKILAYRIVSNKRPGGVAIFQKGDVYKRQVFNAKMQCLSLFTMTRRREIEAFYLVLFENKLGGRLLEGERLLETMR